MYREYFAQRGEFSFLLTTDRMFRSIVSRSHEKMTLTARNNDETDEVPTEERKTALMSISTPARGWHIA